MILGNGKALFLYLFTLVCLAKKSVAFVCNKHALVCETSLEITSQLTMFHETEKAVFPENGNLYRYDVTNTTIATPINIEEVITADGWEKQRVVVVANGTLPGPTITAYEDQILVIHVINRLYSDTVSMHWHGLPQRGTPYMDGVSFVTQCPINPGQTFTYRFRASPKGTYWYHSHAGAQRAKGLYGALIIRERNHPPIVRGVSEDFIMQVQDWNHDYDVDQAFLYSDAGVFLNRQEIKPSIALDGSKFSLWYAQSALINGKGRYYYDPNSGAHNESPLEIFEVEQNRTYRFRLINAAAMYPYRISIDSHPLTVVASDGFYIKPLEVESVIIHPGERFDFLIHANESITNYMIRGHTLERNRRTIAEAVLHYKGAEDKFVRIDSNRQKCLQTNKCLVLNCPFRFYPNEENIECITMEEFRSDESKIFPNASLKHLREYFLNFAFPGPKYTPDSINGVEFTFPTISAISQPTDISNQCHNKDCGEQKVCSCTHSIDLNYNDTIHFVFLNMGKGKGWSHPIHLHGHSFEVLKMGYGNYNSTSGEFISQNADIDCRGGTTKEKSFCNSASWRDPTWMNGNAPGLNVVDPPKKDTVIVPSGGYVVVRITADNPGLWLLHCHIQLHSADGMSVLLNESFSRLPPVPEGFPKCGNFENDGTHSKSTEKEQYDKDVLKETVRKEKNECLDAIHYCSEIKDVCASIQLNDVRNTGCRKFCGLCSGSTPVAPQTYKSVIRTDPYLVPWLQNGIWN